MEAVIILWLALFGACIGSFVNVVVYRLPVKGAFLRQKRSHCPSCGQMLRWFELVPVVSWVILKGRCRSCKAGISPRYPLVEAFCALLAPVCYLRYGAELKALLAFGVLIILLAVALIDLDTMEIPHSLIIALIPFAAGAVFAWEGVSLLERGIGFAAVSLPMFLLALAISGAFGGGDIKLMTVCGFLLGWKNTLFAFFIAVLLGGVYASYLLLSKRGKKGEHIAFGPYLCIGVATALLYGDELVRAYLGLFGL